MIDKVIDISHHQGVVDFDKLAASGIIGVIHKATQGANGKDPAFRRNIDAARDAGLLVGAYHFATGGDGAAQARHFLSVAHDVDLLVLDWEDNPGGTKMTIGAVHSFVKHVHDVRGIWPGLYSGNTAREVLGTTRDDVLANCWLWVARYGGWLPPVIQRTWDRWTLWQYTDKGRVAGINGSVDRNRFAGDDDALRAFWKGQTATAITIASTPTIAGETIDVPPPSEPIVESGSTVTTTTTAAPAEPVVSTTTTTLEGAGVNDPTVAANRFPLWSKLTAWAAASGIGIDTVATIIEKSTGLSPTVQLLLFGTAIGTSLLAGVFIGVRHLMVIWIKAHPRLINTR